ncbi:MAG: diaminopimelate epimerase [Lachnospiraceae bacterium]|jgi:diaminopimelate epimerase|nr:diaminopimelate epimerase [Lachnospiraceae bacterium]
MKFTKMHGCGNDYVYVNGFTEQIKDKVSFVKAVSDRHFGVGGDGAIFINPSANADFEMEMYNADGSRAEMCGNGIRCVAKYVYDYGLTDQTTLRIESAGKVKIIELTVTDGKVSMVRVDMGEPELVPEKIPVKKEGNDAIAIPVEVQGTIYHVTCVSMGNPHAVLFLNAKEDAGILANGRTADLKIEQIGPDFENHTIFPNRTNTEFVEILNRTEVNMRVWERGSGETLACGTGCCATVVAAVLNGLTERKVTVNVLGGAIGIEWDEKTGHVFMTGPATTVFDGEFPWEEA